MFDFGTRRVLAKKVVVLPVPRRPDGLGNKATAAFRADITQNLVDTGSAERALIRTDARLKRGGLAPTSLGIRCWAYSWQRSQSTTNY